MFGMMVLIFKEVYVPKKSIKDQNDPCSKECHQQ